jgi:hypothetical protein
MSTPVTRIVMVGPRGVGKTSLLAAMYNELEKELRAAGCRFFTEPGPTQSKISSQLKALKAAASGSGVKIQTGEGISATQASESYTFHLDVGDGGEPEVSLEFTDLPGGWYTGSGEYKRADELLGNSHVSFLAVDATALMESKPRQAGSFGKYHELINSPFDIQQAYNRVNFADGHVVILTLIRAETYVHKGHTKQLIKQTQKAYAELADILKAKNVPLLGCYVETVGSLTFNAFTDKDGQISSHFLRNPQIGYKPDRCSVPLRIAAGRALSAALDEALVELIREDTFFGNILEMFGFNEALRKARERSNLVYAAFEKLGSAINEDDYFEINA